MTPPQLQDRAYLHDAYVVQRLSTLMIAKLVGCNRATVCRALRRQQIPVRPPALAERCPMLHDRAWLYQRYVVDGQTLDQLALEACCNPASVGKAMHRHDIPIRGLVAPSGPTLTTRNRWPQLCDRAWLTSEYVHRQRPLSAIARFLGCSLTAVRVALRRHGITIRPRGARKKKKPTT